MSNKIVVKHSRIEINNYELGDSPKLEYFFTIYDPLTHQYYYKGLLYRDEEKKLILPRGLDIYWLESLFGEKAVGNSKNDPFDYCEEAIMLKVSPRDDVQKESLRFLLGKGEYDYTKPKSQLGVNLNTGKGKTYAAVAAIAYWNIKSIVIAASVGILEQWKTKILEYTNIDSRDIYMIEGSLSINKLFKRDCSKYKIFLATHSTLKSYGTRNGWNKIGELFKRIKVGIKVYDEAHQNMDNLLLIDFHTNTMKTLYLTATPARSDKSEDSIYQLVFKNVPKIDLFDEDSDPHTKYLALHFNSHPSPSIIQECKNYYGFNRIVYTNYIVTNPYFQKLLFFLMEKIKMVDGKVLIYIGTNQAIMVVYEWMIYNYPELKGHIGVYTSIIKEHKEEQLDCKIILSTTKSCGAAMDIAGLKWTIVLAEPFKSEILARQTLGRTRGNNTLYIDVVDNGFYYTKNYFESKKKIFLKYATECINTTLTESKLEEVYQEVIDRRNRIYNINPIRRIKSNPIRRLQQK